ncbi:MAG: thioredoxin family protein [Verrucomicrobiales bacterium]|nr:thioredoxin family protein [Verrucomicrobiales bacterium]MCP5559766.1 thioredoxin family protein [Verrucomicrobiaceae bacterium]
MKKSFSALCVLIFMAASAIAGGPEKITDLSQALAQAKEQGKLLFVQYGRDACSNCQALRSYVKEKDLRLSESKYVYADVDCDDPATIRLFGEKFKVVGNTLPFVVIAAPDGTQLAARSGYGSVRDYEDLLRDAGKAAKKKE